MNRNVLSDNILFTSKIVSTNALENTHNIIYTKAMAVAIFGHKHIYHILYKYKPYFKH